MSRFIGFLFLCCCVLWPVACTKRGELPSPIDPLPDLTEEPKQGAARLEPFHVEQAGTRYLVEPLHSYRLAGLVVSLARHSGDHLVHRLWKDHLNVADLCVVWGENAKSADLEKFSFESGEFTCFYRTRDDAAWRSFRPTQLSNNHLLAADPELRDQISRVQIGDQVRFEGYLARYSNDQGFSRGTSTTRDDTGNGACETVYVTRLEVLRPSRSVWHHVENGALMGLFSTATLWLVGVMRGRF